MEMHLQSEEMCVLFDGTKPFWESRSYLKIKIVSHTKQNCIEIIAHDPVSGAEFPRIYLDSPLVISKLDKDIIEKTCASKKETLQIDSKGIIKNEDILHEVKSHMMMKYVYSRINLTSLAVEGNAIQLVLQPSFEDVMVEGDESLMKLDVERLKPDDLIPFKVEENIVIS